MAWHMSGVDHDQLTGKPLIQDTRHGRFLVSSKEGSTFTIAEVQGTALKRVMELVEWLAHYIEVAHNQIRDEKVRGSQSEEEVALHGVAAKSNLEMWVSRQEDGWNKVLALMARMGGHSEIGEATIPKDFGLPPAGIQRLVELAVEPERPQIHHRNLFRAMERHGDIDGRWFDYGLEDERAATYTLSDALEALGKMVKKVRAQTGADAAPDNETTREED